MSLNNYPGQDVNKKGKSNLHAAAWFPSAEDLRKPPAGGLCVDSQVELMVTGLSQEGQGVGRLALWRCSSPAHCPATRFGSGSSRFAAVTQLAA